MTFRMPFAMAVLVLLLLSVMTSHAQISIPGKPLSFYSSLLPQGRQQRISAVYKLRSVDNANELQRANEYEKECPTCKGEYYGTGLDVSIDIKAQGEILTVAGGKLWRMVIESETALGMQFHFSKYKLPKSASLFVYNEDRSEIIGAFTHINNHRDEKFATGIVHGDRIVLEYFEADNAEFEGKIAIHRVIHVFKNISRDILLSKSGRTSSYEDDCDPINIRCPEGVSLWDERKAVCRILGYDESKYLGQMCSGFLVNNNQSIRKSYVLTAGHCLESLITGMDPPSRYYNFIFEFDFEQPSCDFNTTDPLPFWSFQGAEVATRGDKRQLDKDFALFDLQTTSTQQYANFIGWDRRDNINYLQTANISHPWGVTKKIALDYDAPKKVGVWENMGGEIFVDPAATVATHWELHWNKGVPAGGSSGSPLIDRSSELALGVYVAGASQCDTGYTLDGPDLALRFSKLWSKYSAPYDKPLGYFLDPTGGTEVLASYIPNPEAGPDGPGGGPGGSPGKRYPRYGANLSATYMLGDFDGLSDLESVCEGNYSWKVSHGRIYAEGKGLIELQAEDHGTNARFTTAITKTFNFVKGREYILSLQVFDPNVEQASTDHLGVMLGNNIPIYGCVTNRINAGFVGQSILKLEHGKYIDGSHWKTFAIRFTPDNNYNTIYMILVPNGPRNPITYWLSANVMIDRVAIHEKGDFYNPQVPNNVTITSGTLPQKLMADETLTVSGVNVNAGSNVQLTSHQVKLLPGFKVLQGATFVAKADDCIEATAIDQPIGPLENNQASGRAPEDDEYYSWIENLSHQENVYEYRPADVSVAWEQKEAGQLVIFPNPSSTFVTVDCENFQGMMLIIRDINGRPAGDMVIDEPKMILDLRQFSKGFYFIEVVKDGKRHVGKLVVK